MNPKLFVASSVEGLDIAHAIQANLEHDADVTVWEQGVFGLSEYPMESLLRAIDETDFGAFVFSADDVIRMRKSEYKVVRHNVIFELGLFIGRLGRERNFIVQPGDEKRLQLPSDLLGLTPGRFPHREDGNLEAALGPVCCKIREAMRRLGALGRSSVITAVDPSALIDSQTELSLSVEAKQLLIEASKDKRGLIIVVTTTGGTAIQTNQRNMITEQTARQIAVWKDALQELEYANMAQYASSQTGATSYCLTGKGYKFADQLNSDAQ
jgi:hypothetical protein